MILVKFDILVGTYIFFHKFTNFLVYSIKVLLYLILIILRHFTVYYIDF